jgi:hypothetical protein
VNYTNRERGCVDALLRLVPGWVEGLDPNASPRWEIERVGLQGPPGQAQMFVVLRDMIEPRAVGYVYPVAMAGDPRFAENWDPDEWVMLALTEFREQIDTSPLPPADAGGTSWLG